MFVLKELAEITVDVPIQVPGEAEPSTIQARWRLHPWSDYRRIVADLEANQLSDEQLVEDDLLELIGIADEQGEPLAHSAELVGQLMDLAYVRRPLVLSWFTAQEGRAAAAVKN